MPWEITLTIQGEKDHTFFMTDEDMELNYQSALVEECERANIDTKAVINATSEQVSDEDFDLEPEHGDRVTCHYCTKEFTYTDPSAQQVGTGMYWCGCKEEQ